MYRTTELSLLFPPFVCLWSDAGSYGDYDSRNNCKKKNEEKE